MTVAYGQDRMVAVTGAGSFRTRAFARPRKRHRAQRGRLARDGLKRRSAMARANPVGDARSHRIEGIEGQFDPAAMDGGRGAPKSARFASDWATARRCLPWWSNSASRVRARTHRRCASTAGACEHAPPTRKTGGRFLRRGTGAIGCWCRRRGRPGAGRRRPRAGRSRPAASCLRRARSRRPGIARRRLAAGRSCCSSRSSRWSASQRPPGEDARHDVRAGDAQLLDVVAVGGRAARRPSLRRKRGAILGQPWAGRWLMKCSSRA